MTRTSRLTFVVLAGIAGLGTLSLVGSLNTTESRGAISYQMGCNTNWQNGGCGTPAEVNGANHGGSSAGNKQQLSG